MVDGVPSANCVAITIGAGGNGADDLIAGTTAGVDNKMILMGGVAILGSLLLLGGSRAARKDKQ